MPTQFVYFPIYNRKEKRSNAYRSVFAPTTGRFNSYDTDTRYSPETYLRRKSETRSYYDYNPSFHSNTYYDYSPTNYFSQKFRQKYSPISNYVNFNRYAPSQEEELYYEPKMVSRFKPQVVLVSNYDTLDSYYNYVIKLLNTIR